jgi:hypothetical protein
MMTESVNDCSTYLKGDTNMIERDYIINLIVKRVFCNVMKEFVKPNPKLVSLYNTRLN